MASSRLATLFVIFTGFLCSQTRYFLNFQFQHVVSSESQCVMLLQTCGWVALLCRPNKVSIGAILYSGFGQQVQACFVCIMLTTNETLFAVIFEPVVSKLTELIHEL
jgi:hypothetical protein